MDKVNIAIGEVVNDAIIKARACHVRPDLVALGCGMGQEAQPARGLP